MKIVIPKVTTIDYETWGIEGRPNYPPKPVGVSVKEWGAKPHYYAWGHPTGNNCQEKDGKAAVLKAFKKGPTLFHNGKFDIDVGETHLGLPRQKWDAYHDTLYLLFLDNPHAMNLSLKPSAHRLLGMPAEEQDAVKNWLLKNQPLKDKGIKMTAGADGDHYFAKYICLAPGDLVGRYANGDTIRTEKLFQLLYKKNAERGMQEPYDRERQLMPILLGMERQGLQVDFKRLTKDVKNYGEWLQELDAWVIKTLKCSTDINLNSGQQLVDAMLKAKKVDKGLLGLTPTGRPRTDKDSLMDAVSDKTLLAVLKYRTQLSTCMRTFMQPWLRTAQKSGGKIFTNWNQVKGTDASGNHGARTGRLSSSPNFQNIPKTFKPIFHHESPKAKLPKSPFKGLPALPIVRRYITPFPGHVLIDRDYSQQEPRILAHFEGGSLMDQYRADPWIDFHTNAQLQLQQATGRAWDRKDVKIANLGLIYGKGIALLSAETGLGFDETKELKASLLAMYPGLNQMNQEMKLRARSKKPIRTWGGREYYCEPSAIIKGRFVTFDYKLVNVLIQGSASDCTKEGIIRFEKVRRKNWFLILNVHDQLTVSCPPKEVPAAMEALRKTMESVEFDVQILSEGTTSRTNWAELKPYDKKGKVLK